MPWKSNLPPLKSDKLAKRGSSRNPLMTFWQPDPPDFADRLMTEGATAQEPEGGGRGNQSGERISLEFLVNP